MDKKIETKKGRIRQYSRHGHREGGKPRKAGIYRYMKRAAKAQIRRETYKETT